MHLVKIKAIIKWHMIWHMIINTDFQMKKVIDQHHAKMDLMQYADNVDLDLRATCPLFCKTTSYRFINEQCSSQI